MKKITADLMHFKTLNDLVRDCEDHDIFIENCIGQRYIAASSKGKNIIITGTPGNALGAYLDGSEITVNGNAQKFAFFSDRSSGRRRNICKSVRVEFAFEIFLKKPTEYIFKMDTYTLKLQVIRIHLNKTEHLNWFCQ